MQPEETMDEDELEEILARMDEQCVAPPPAPERRLSAEQLARVMPVEFLNLPRRDEVGQISEVDIDGFDVGVEVTEDVSPETDFGVVGERFGGEGGFVAHGGHNFDFLSRLWEEIVEESRNPTFGGELSSLEKLANIWNRI